MFPSHTETLQCRNDLLLQMRRVQAKFQGSESAGHQGELPRERGHPAKGREAMNSGDAGKALQPTAGGGTIVVRGSSTAEAFRKLATIHAAQDWLRAARRSMRFAEDFAEFADTHSAPLRETNRELLETVRSIRNICENSNPTYKVRIGQILAFLDGRAAR